MLDKFLNAKHWQLFILMFGIPIVLQIAMMAIIFSNFDSESNPEDVFGIMKYFSLATILNMGILFGWFWSVAIGLQRKVPENIKLKTKRFKILFLIPLVYIILMSLFIGYAFNGMMEFGSEPNFNVIGGMMGIIFPLHLLSMVGIFHSMYFVAKTIKTVELQREVGFGDFAGEFFMIWFYFIGIWFLQPKINKMVEDS